MYVSGVNAGFTNTFRTHGKQAAGFGAVATRAAIVATGLKTYSASRQSVRRD
jgi:hypothetical protein